MSDALVKFQQESINNDDDPVPSQNNDQVCFLEFFSAWPLMAWILVRSTWSFSTRYNGSNMKEKYCSVYYNICSFCIWGNNKVWVTVNIWYITYCKDCVKGFYLILTWAWAKSRLTSQVNNPCEFYIHGRHCWIWTELEKGGRNRVRRKVDISVHVGWEFVGRGAALYQTCGEGKTKVRGWLYRS